MKGNGTLLSARDHKRYPSKSTSLESFSTRGKRINMDAVKGTGISETLVQKKIKEKEKKISTTALTIEYPKLTQSRDFK